MLGAGFVWSYYLGHAIAIIIFRNVTPLSRKLFLIIFSFIQGLLVACQILSIDILFILIFRTLLGFFAITDIFLKDYIEASSTKFNRTLNVLVILFTPHAISIAFGCLLTSFTLSNHFILSNIGVLKLPAAVISVLIILMTLLTSLLVPSGEINTYKNVLPYVESEGKLVLMNIRIAEGSEE